MRGKGERHHGYFTEYPQQFTGGIKMKLKFLHSRKDKAKQGLIDMAPNLASAKGKNSRPIAGAAVKVKKKSYSAYMKMRG